MGSSFFIMALLKTLCIVSVLIYQATATKLQVSGTDLTYNGEKVFLNGVNIAWNDYGNDFGNGAYNGKLEQWVSDIGNDGFVTSCDNTGDFVNDFKKLLDHAQNEDVLVIPVLWNGAYLTNQEVINLIWDDNKLDSYISNCLDEFVKAVKDHPALGAWEVINEPGVSLPKMMLSPTPKTTTLMIV